MTDGTVKSNTYAYYFAFNVPGEENPKLVSPINSSDKVLNVINGNYVINDGGVSKIYQYALATQGCNNMGGPFGYTFGSFIYYYIEEDGEMFENGIVVSVENGDYLFSNNEFDTGTRENIQEYLVRPVVILDKNINNQQIRKSNRTFTEEPVQNYVSDPNL